MPTSRGQAGAVLEQSRPFQIGLWFLHPPLRGGLLCFTWECVGRFANWLIRTEDRLRALMEVVELPGAERPAERKHRSATEQHDGANHGREQSNINRAHGFLLRTVRSEE